MVLNTEDISRGCRRRLLNMRALHVFGNLLAMFMNDNQATTPDAVVAEVIKTTCCLSVLPKWRENCGYNFRAACEAADKGQATSSVSG